MSKSKMFFGLLGLVGAAIPAVTTLSCNSKKTETSLNVDEAKLKKDIFTATSLGFGSEVTIDSAKEQINEEWVQKNVQLLFEKTNILIGKDDVVIVGKSILNDSIFVTLKIKGNSVSFLINGFKKAQDDVANEQLKLKQDKFHVSSFSFGANTTAKDAKEQINKEWLKNAKDILFANPNAFNESNITTVDTYIVGNNIFVVLKDSTSISNLTFEILNFAEEQNSGGINFSSNIALYSSDFSDLNNKSISQVEDILGSNDKAKSWLIKNQKTIFNINQSIDSDLNISYNGFEGSNWRIVANVFGKSVSIIILDFKTSYSLSNTSFDVKNDLKFNEEVYAANFLGSITKNFVFNYIDTIFNVKGIAKFSDIQNIATTILDTTSINVEVTMLDNKFSFVINGFKQKPIIYTTKPEYNASELNINGLNPNTHTLYQYLDHLYNSTNAKTFVENNKVIFKAKGIEAGNASQVSITGVKIEIGDSGTSSSGAIKVTTSFHYPSSTIEPVSFKIIGLRFDNKTSYIKNISVTAKRSGTVGVTYTFVITGHHLPTTKFRNAFDMYSFSYKTNGQVVYTKLYKGNWSLTKDTQTQERIVVKLNTNISSFVNHGIFIHRAGRGYKSSSNSNHYMEGIHVSLPNL